MTQAANVRGQVWRPDGHPAAGAVVTLLDPEGGQVGSAATTATGAYEVPLPAAGRYLLVVAAPGHAPWVRYVMTSGPDIEMPVVLPDPATPTPGSTAAPGGPAGPGGAAVSAAPGTSAAAAGGPAGPGSAPAAQPGHGTTGPASSPTHAAPNGAAPNGMPPAGAAPGGAVPGGSVPGGATPGGAAYGGSGWEGAAPGASQGPGQGGPARDGAGRGTAQSGYGAGDGGRGAYPPPAPPATHVASTPPNGFPGTPPATSPPGATPGGTGAWSGGTTPGTWPGGAPTGNGAAGGAAARPDGAEPGAWPGQTPASANGGPDGGGPVTGGGTPAGREQSTAAAAQVALDAIAHGREMSANNLYGLITALLAGRIELENDPGSALAKTAARIGGARGGDLAEGRRAADAILTPLARQLLTEDGAARHVRRDDAAAPENVVALLRPLIEALATDLESRTTR